MLDDPTIMDSSERNLFDSPYDLLKIDSSPWTGPRARGRSLLPSGRTEGAAPARRCQPHYEACSSNQLWELFVQCGDKTNLSPLKVIKTSMGQLLLINFEVLLFLKTWTPPARRCHHHYHHHHRFTSLATRSPFRSQCHFQPGICLPSRWPLQQGGLAAN